MKKFLDEHGLQTYDQKIKEYIGNNAFNPSSMQTVNETVTMNQAQADWNQSDSSAKDFIKNKPDIYQLKALRERYGYSVQVVKNGLILHNGEQFVIGMTLDRSTNPNYNTFTFNNDGWNGCSWYESKFTGKNTMVLSLYDVSDTNHENILATAELSLYEKATSIDSSVNGYTTGDQVKTYVDGQISNLSAVATTGSYKDLKDIPYGLETETMFNMGNFKNIINPEYIDPTTGDWVDPNDWSNTKSIQEAWGYDSLNDYYDPEKLESDSLITESSWGDEGDMSSSRIIWGDASDVSFYFDEIYYGGYQENENFGFITEPSDLLNYSVSLTCNGTDYLLPIQFSNSNGFDHYYVGQNGVGSEITSTQALALYTHPFSIYFSIISGELYSIRIYLRMAGDVELSNVKIVRVGQAKMSDSQYIPATIARVSDLTAKVPDAPTTDGTYVLKVTVTSGVPTYSWVSA